MRLPLLDPRDLPRLAERVAQTLDEIVGLVPRASALIASGDVLLQEARRLVERIETTRLHADELVRGAAASQAGVDRVIADAEAAVRRVLALVEAVEEPLQRLQPTLARLADTTSPGEVEALVRLVDRVPALVDDLEAALPVADALRTVGPDVRELLEIASELNEVLRRVPGVGRLKKRVEQEHVVEGVVEGAARDPQ